MWTIDLILWYLFCAVVGLYEFRILTQKGD